MLTLDASPLGDAIGAINRYNRVRIRLAPGVSRSRPLTGAFRATDPQGFAQAVARLLSLRVVQDNATLLTLSPRE